MEAWEACGPDIEDMDIMQEFLDHREEILAHPVLQKMCLFDNDFEEALDHALYDMDIARNGHTTIAVFTPSKGLNAWYELDVIWRNYQPQALGVWIHVALTEKPETWHFFRGERALRDALDWLDQFLTAEERMYQLQKLVGLL